MSKKDSLLTTKAEILCWGIKKSSAAEKIWLLQHPTFNKRTGNTGLQIALDKNLVLNAIYGEDFCDRAPYEIRKSKNKFWLYKNGARLQAIEVIKAPKWYKQKTTDGRLMSDVLQQEGEETLIASILNNCCYFQDGSQCRFCILGHERETKPINAEQMTETVLAAQAENSNYHLHLTAGNTFSSDHGAKIYEKYIKSIRRRSNIPISLEISPPENIKDLERLIALGVNGFSINIEVWDENTRKKICPGKSKIKRDLYFKAWKKSAKLLGAFKTSSVMLVGLDNPRNIKIGIEEMIKMKVKPVLIPFKPFRSSILNNLKPTNPQELFRLSRIAGHKLAQAQAKNFIGCERCGACTMEKDFIN